MPETSAEECRHKSGILKALRIPLKIIAFLLILILLLPITATCLSSNYTKRIHEFYKEDKDSLDAVFIGSSNTHAFWSPLYAWKNHGIATFNYSADAQTILSYRYMIEEVIKYQPQAVIVITLSSPIVAPNKEYFHSLTDAMPFSLTKLRLIDDYSKQNDLTLKDRLEYYITLYRYHSRWDSLAASDFEKTETTVPKAPNCGNSYRNKSLNIKSIYTETDETADLPENTQTVLNNLLDYCEEQNLSVLFLRTPQAGRTKSALAKMNAMYSLIESRGFPVLKMHSLSDEIGLDLEYDFYDKYHTNIHGSLKYTDYVAEYLISQYGLNDRRGDPEYQDFDDAFSAYKPYTDPFLFPFEDGGAPRDYSLSAPEKLSAKYDKASNSTTVTWKQSEQDVDGYTIFRKCTNGTNYWYEIGTVDSSASSFIDGDRVKGKVYYYTVVPFTEEQGIRTYGDLNYLGIKVAVPAT